MKCERVWSKACASILVLSIVGGCHPRSHGSTGSNVSGTNQPSRPGGAAIPAPLPDPTPIPDLADGGAAWQSNDPVIVPGANFTVGGRVLNQGTAPAAGFWVDFYVSRDNQIDSATDLRIGSSFVPGLDTGASADTALTVAFPAMPPGTYFVGWKIDASGVVGERSESNNVVVVAGPSLLVRDAFESNDGMAAAWYLGAPGGTLTATGTIDSASDEDWFSFDEVAGGTVRVTLSTLPADYDLEIYAMDGSILFSSAQAGLASEEIDFITPSSSLYYVRVFSSSGAFNTDMTYELQVRIP